MTTATKTQPRKTKKKKAKKSAVKRTSAKRKKGAAAAKTKKPSWTLVTFEQIEEWREKIGLSKSGMAEALQVTNSTYHNWRRGTTVPHPNQQEDILQRLRALESNASASKGKSGGKPAGRRGKGSNSNGAAGGRNRLGDYDGANGTGGIDDGLLDGPAPRRSSHQDRVSPGTHRPSSYVPEHPREDIASITVAFIQSQKKAVSAGSIFEFVKGLREVL